MSPESRHERLSALFAAASALPAPERSAFLDAECGGDEDLRAELESLLRLGSESDSLLDAGPGSTLRRGIARSLDDGPASNVPLPATIGDYRIVGLLGRGGMGVVYEAEQQKPKRRVALKVLRVSAPDPEARRRFELEAEILGRLQHPGIAQVLEAGVAEIPGFGPQPYLAMELVRGTTLSRWAREQGLSVRRKVELLAQACDAVQHAHERGVIHRDLKPGNILVGEDGRPRVVDFGIARVTDPGGATLLTATGHVLGTLAYMAPEQVRGRPKDIDARTDGWALGAIGWELLTGRPPHDVTDLPLPEAARRISDDEVPRLSSLNRELRGDLETILGKALDRDPARRYASASELAADLRRWLADEPIQARPPSALYQLRKFSRRHWGIVTGAAVAAVALVIGTGVATWQAGVARRQAADAEAARADAERLAYRASLTGAVAALEGENFFVARRQVHDAPVALRGWEWHVLDARLDTSVPGDWAAAETPMAADEAVTSAARERLAASLGAPPMVGLSAALPDGDVALALLPGSGDKADGPGALVKIDPATGDVAWTAPGVSGFAQLLLLDGGRLLAAEGDTARLVLIDPASGRILRDTGPLNDDLLTIAASPDGRRVVTGSANSGTLRVFDADTLAMLARREIARVRGLAVTFAAGGRIIVSSGPEGSLTSWTPDLAERIDTYPGRGTNVIRLAELPQAGLVVATDDAQRRAAWTTDRLERRADVLGPAGAYLYIALWDATASRVTGLTFDGTLLTWDARTGRLVRGPVAIADAEPVYPQHAAFAKDGTLLVSAANGPLLRIEPATGRVLSRRAGCGGGLATAPDGTLAVTSGRDGTCVVDMATLDLLRHDPTPASAVAWSRDGKWIATCSNAGELRLRDAATLAVARGFAASPGTVRDVAWSPDGAHVAVAYDERRVEVFSTAGERVAVLPHEGRVFSVLFSPDGSRLLMSGDGGLVHVVETRRWEEVVALAGHGSYIWSACWAPDGRTLVTASGDETARIWRAERLADGP